MVALDRSAGALTQVRGELLAPRRKVGEDEDLLVGGEHRLDDLIETVEFSGTSVETIVISLVVHRMVADLLQRRNRSEHGALALIASLLRFGGGDDEAVDHGLVQPDLLGRHRTVVEFVDAIGEFFRDRRFGLGSAVHEDAIEGTKRAFAVAACLALRRRRELGDERCPGTKQARIRPIHDRPQVAEAVLDRGAGERQPSASLETAELLGDLGGGVLDRLRLVDDDLAPLKLAELVHIADRRAIGRDHEVRSANGRPERRPLGTVATVVNEHIDLGNELASLRCPVAHDGRRCDHERGTSLTRQRDAREGRRCLAETHIERQAPAEPGIVEEGEPSERIGLIGPEFTCEPLGRRRRLLGERLDAP